MIGGTFPFLILFYFACSALPPTVFAGEDVLEKSDNCGNDPLGIYDGHLILKSLVTSRDDHSRVDRMGYLTIMGGDSKYTSFSLDVGFNRGQTSTEWHAKQPNLYVIAIEANSHLVRQFENGLEFESVRMHTMVVHAAASSRPGVMTFNPGKLRRVALACADSLVLIDSWRCDVRLVMLTFILLPSSLLLYVVVVAVDAVSIFYKDSAGETSATRGVFFRSKT
jgi:hypothetical protein